MKSQGISYQTKSGYPVIYFVHRNNEIKLNGRCSKILNASCLPKMPKQTMQTKKQSDQGLPCLLFWQAFL